MVGGAETDHSLLLEEAIASLVRVHFGRSFGLAIEVAWVILGLVPCGLFITGLMMWWNRVLRTAVTRAAAGTEPERPNGADPLPLREGS